MREYNYCVILEAYMLPAPTDNTNEKKPVRASIVTAVKEFIKKLRDLVIRGANFVRRQLTRFKNAISTLNRKAQNITDKIAPDSVTLHKILARRIKNMTTLTVAITARGYQAIDVAFSQSENADPKGAYDDYLEKLSEFHKIDAEIKDEIAMKVKPGTRMSLAASKDLLRTAITQIQAIANFEKVCGQALENANNEIQIAAKFQNEAKIHAIRRACKPIESVLSGVNIVTTSWNNILVNYMPTYTIDSFNS